MQKNTHAILFDIGGTLRTAIRHSELQLANIDRILELAGISGPSREWADTILQREKAYYRWATLSMIELDEVELWRKWLLPEADPDQVKTNAISMNKLWRDSRSQKIPLGDMADTIKELARRGYRLGIISNTTSTIEAPAMLAEEGLTGLVDTVVLSSLVGRRKPHPSLFLEAARELGVDPASAVYVGDRPSRDVVGAREAGYQAVVIIQLEGRDPEKERSPQSPDYRITKLPELLDIFPAVKPGKIRRERSKSPIKYDCSISSMWAVGKFPTFNDFFCVSREMGIARFELNHQVHPDQLNAIDLNQFHINSLHEPCPATIALQEMDRRDWMLSSLDPENRAIAVRSAKATVDQAVRLGCRYVVIHPGTTGIDHGFEKRIRQEFEKEHPDQSILSTLRAEIIEQRGNVAAAHLEATAKSLKGIGEYAMRAGIAIALENRYHYYDIPILDELGVLLDLFDDFAWGFNYDIGHAQALDRLGFFPHGEWLKRYGDRMIATHIHDVSGIRDHGIPGTGDMDFKWVAKNLPSSAYRTLEVSPEHSVEHVLQGLDHLVKSGCITLL